VRPDYTAHRNSRERLGAQPAQLRSQESEFWGLRGEAKGDVAVITILRCWTSRFHQRRTLHSPSDGRTILSYDANFYLLDFLTAFS